MLGCLFVVVVFLFCFVLFVLYMYVCVHACVRVCVRACVRECVRVCVWGGGGVEGLQTHFRHVCKVISQHVTGLTQEELQQSDLGTAITQIYTAIRPGVSWLAAIKTAVFGVTPCIHV